MTALTALLGETILEPISEVGSFTCALGWLAFRFPEIDWRTDYPNLAKLFDKLSERPSFKDSLPE